ncbi:MAG: hypothetical protein H6816_16145, partial [Phycisphaerales bacterium]|nr:hypothetical protein [Phycisphaerales bacterium]
HATENRSSNNWWLSALDEAQTKQQYLEEQGEQARLYREVGLAELNELARLLFSPDRRCEFLVRPK